MSRVRLVDKIQASAEVVRLYTKIEENGAKVLNIYRVLAHNPDALRDFMRLGNSLLARTELLPRLRELAILRIAKLTGCEYEWMQHFHTALALGVSPEQTDELSRWESSTSFGNGDRAVLQYTDEVMQAVEVKDKTYRALAKHISERSIVELTLSIGYWGMLARIAVALQIEIDAESASSLQDLIGH